MKSHSLEHLKTKLKSLVDFLTPLLPLANSHLVQFIVQDQWHSLLPRGIEYDLCNIEFSKLNLIATAQLCETPIEKATNDSKPFTSLCNFIIKVRNLQADKLDILTSLSNIQELLIKEDYKTLLENAMPQKKAYEVSCLSQLIAGICEKNLINSVVDIGSGLGYLSSALVIQHNLNVFAIDSSNSNIKNTLKRSNVLHSLWKRSEEKISSKNLKLEIKNSKSKTLPSNINEINDKYISFAAFEGKFVGLTRFISDNEDLAKLFISNGNHKFVEENIGLVGLHTCGNLASTSLKLFAANSIAKLLCNVGCCYHLLEEEFATDFFHLRKYTEISNVANCDSKQSGKCLDSRYHCPEVDPLHRKKTGREEIGFPLCSYLKKIKFSLGRNARDLASKPASRMSAMDKNLQSLYWRALLEAIVTDLHGSWPQNALVGKKTSKTSTSFYDYYKKSMLSIGLPYELTEEQIMKYTEKFASKEHQLIRFYFLKASLGPLIETLINLDRLVFLHEQGFKDSHMVQIFDSVISPRCTAIVSFK